MFKECVLVVCDALHLLHYWMMCYIPFKNFLTCLKSRRRVFISAKHEIYGKSNVKHNKLKTIDLDTLSI